MISLKTNSTFSVDLPRNLDWNSNVNVRNLIGIIQVEQLIKKIKERHICPFGIKDQKTYFSFSELY